MGLIKFLHCPGAVFVLTNSLKRKYNISKIKIFIMFINDSHEILSEIWPLEIKMEFI